MFLRFVIHFLLGTIAFPMVGVWTGQLELPLVMTPAIAANLAPWVVLSLLMGLSCAFLSVKLAPGARLSEVWSTVCALLFMIPAICCELLPLSFAAPHYLFSILTYLGIMIVALLLNLGEALVHSLVEG